jgi:hypothetical protein
MVVQASRLPNVRPRRLRHHRVHQHPRGNGMKKLLFLVLALAVWAGCGRSPGLQPQSGQSQSGQPQPPQSQPSQHNAHYWPAEAAAQKPAYGLPLVIECQPPKVPPQLLKASPPIRDVR